MFERIVLPNGLRVLTSTMPHTRSVSVGIFVGAGSRYEDDALAGASHFLEHMLFKGTAKRPEPQLISSAIESVGGIINASTDREMTIYWIKVAADHFDLAIDVLADMVQHPLLADEEHQRERRVILEELAMTYDQPDAYADLLIDQTLWPDQPMGRDIGGTRESVGALSRQTLVDYHAHQYAPKNSVVAIAGNVSHDEAVAAVERLLGGWAEATPLDWYRVEPPVEGSPRVSLGHRKTDQAHIALAMDGISSLDPRRYAMGLLNTMLGEGMSSRLFMELRERRGLAYDVASHASHYRDCGALTVYCGVDPVNINEALRVVQHELGRMPNDVTDDELDKAKAFATGRLYLRLEDTRAVMSWMGGQELLYDKVRLPEEVVANVRAVTVSDVKAMAQEHLLPGAFKLAVVGPYRSEARFQKLLAA